MRVCAEAIPPGKNRPAVPTSGYRRRFPAADLSLIGPPNVSNPTRRPIGRGYAAVR
jgi:hypothetical protein